MILDDNTLFCKHGTNGFTCAHPDCEDFVIVEAVSLRDDPSYVKCERCWNYHTCKMNFMQCCDRCCKTLLGLDDSVVAPHFKEEIRESFRKQAVMFKAKVV